jgi:hypothetical protein
MVIGTAQVTPIIFVDIDALDLCRGSQATVNCVDAFLCSNKYHDHYH